MQQNFDSENTTDNSKSALSRAAMHLFAHKGYDGVSVKEIAEKAGVNVGLISYYFGGKEGIYHQCLAEAGQRSLSSARRILTPAKSLFELELRLQLYAEDIIDAHIKNPEAALLIQKECERDSKEVEVLFKSTYSHVFKMLETFFTSAIESKIIRNDLEPRMLSFLFHGQIMHAKLQDKNALRFYGISLTQPDYRSTFIHHLISTFVGGLSISEVSQ